MSCFLCGKDSSKNCGECRLPGCPSHLQYHNRGGVCAPWRVENVPGAGRGLVAARNIKAGEVVVEDWAVVEGPLFSAVGCCVVCLSDEGASGCPDCTLPVCKSRTRGCKATHKVECRILKKGLHSDLSKEQMYTVIAAVRLMWACERDLGYRELLDPLMDHRDIHQGKLEEGEEEPWGKVVTFLEANGFERGAIERSLGLLQTNGVTSSSVGGQPRGHALYPIFSIVNNSCLSNTRHGKKEEAFCLIATVDIQIGSEITTSYKTPTLGNIIRQQSFQQLWNFQCSCQRCVDPTELGTYSSSLLCTSCTAPVVQCSPDIEDDWKCEKCFQVYKTKFIQDKTVCYQRLVSTTGQGMEKLENLLTILSRVLHSQHFIIMQIKRQLLLLYGNCASHRLESLTRDQLDRKIGYCRDYIAVFSKLEPGLTKWKARVTEELAGALVQKEGRPGVEVCRLIGESGKCRELDSQEEKAAFSMRIAKIMSK